MSKVLWSMLKGVYQFYVGTGRFCLVSSRCVCCQMVFGLNWHVKCVCDAENGIDYGDDGTFGCGSSLLFCSIFLGGD